MTQPTPVKPIQKKKDTPKPAVKKTPPIQDKKVAGKPKAPPKVPPKQEKRGKVSDALLKDLDDQIKALDKKSSFKKAAPYVPAVTEQDYSSDLASLLHQSLNLPDHGEVKIKLTVRKDGTVVSVAILQAESEKNRQYLQENLPKLRFPSFQGSFAKNAQHTFVLTFCNEL